MAAKEGPEVTLGCRRFPPVGLPSPLSANEFCNISRRLEPVQHMEPQ